VAEIKIGRFGLYNTGFPCMFALMSLLLMRCGWGRFPNSVVGVVFALRVSPALGVAPVWRRNLCRTSLLCFVCLLCLSGCGSSSEKLAVESATGSAQQDSRKLEEAFHDVGNVFAGQPAEHVFAFRNESANTLSLAPGQDVRKTCGCTSADVSTTKLAPGESTQVKLSISTGAKHGAFAEKVVVTWHAADQTITRGYTLSGTAVQAFRFDPPQAYLRAEDVRKQRMVSVRIHSDLDLDWSTLKVTPLDKTVRASIEKPSNNGDPIIGLRVAGDRAGVLIRTVKVAARLKSNPDSQLSGELPVMMEDSGELRLASKSTLAAFDGAGSVYNGHIILRCDKSESAKVTDSLSLTLLPHAETKAESPLPEGRKLKFDSRMIASSLIRLDFSIPAALLGSDAPGKTKILVRSGDFEDRVNLILP
jgi:hypothetical protein